MFEIYSIGDGFYLTRVLNAVAALSGTDDMRLLASVGFLVGVIVTMLQSAFQARAPQMQTFFVSLVIYLAMFGASARVTVEDVFSGDTWVVDNVPIGVAAVGSGVSQLGYGVTRLFETAFATPSITDGYVRPLTLLQDVRKHTQSLVALGTANYPDGNQNTDLTRSMVSYINDCPLYEIDRGTRSWNEFMHARGWANTYASTQQAITTRLYLNGGVQDLTCRDAWTMLQDYIAVNLVPALEDSLAAATANDAATFPAELQTVLDNVAGAGIDARNYMVQSAFLPLMIQANANASAELQDWGQAAMIEQAGQQRNTQWAAEEVLFSRYVHPVMTFFEAFMFAAAPLMVFAIGLGPMGLKIVSRYLVFGLWIQLWMPVLAITNLYTVTGAERHVDALRDAAISNAHPDSIAGIFAMDRVIGDFLGTAGMLAASTPFITLMLIYGSAYTATALAGRLQGGDHIDEKIVSPSLATVGPLMQQSPGYANEPVGGTRAYGGEKVLPRFETQRSEDSLVKSFEAESRQAQTRFGQSLSSVVQESSQALRRGGHGESISDNMVSGYSREEQRISDAAREISERYGYGSGAQEAVEGALRTLMRGQVSGAVSADASRVARRHLEGIRQSAPGAGDAAAGDAVNTTPGKGANAGLSGNVAGGAELMATQSHRSGETTTEDLMTAVQRSAKELVSDRATMASNLAYDARHNYENTFTVGASDAAEDRLQRSAEEVVQKSQGFERAEQFAERFGGGMSVSGEIIANRLANDPEAMGRAEQLFATKYGGYAGELSRRQQMYERVLPQDNARALAMASLLTGIGDKSMHMRMSPEERMEAAAHGWSLIDQAVGTGVPDGLNPYRNAGVGGEAPAFGVLPGEVGGAVDDGARRRNEGLDAYAERLLERGQNRMSGGPALVAAKNELDVAETRLASAEDRMEQAAESRSLWEERVRLAADQRVSLAQSAAEMQQRVFNGLGASMEKWTDGAKAAFVSVMGALRDGRSFQEAVQTIGPAWESNKDEIIGRALDDVRGSGDAQLTDAQLGYYESMVRTELQEISGPEAVAAREAARQRVIDEQENPRTGEDIADLVERAAWMQDDGALRAVRGFNLHDGQFDSAKTDAEKASIDKAMAEERLEQLDLQNPGRSAGDGVEMRLEAPGDLPEHFRRLEAEFGLPRGWLTANAAVESSFAPNARSAAGAVGMHQFTEETARDYNLRDRTDPYESARAAGEYFRDLHDRFGSWEHAVAAYNMGPNGLAQRLEDGRELPAETQTHVPKFFDALERANTPAAAGVGIAGAAGAGQWQATPLTRDALPAPGQGERYISLDFNSSADGQARGVEIVIPDDASVLERRAAEAYVQETAGFFERHGVDVPIRGVRTTSENGRGAPGRFHTEPFFVQDDGARAVMQRHADEYALILASTLGRIPGATFHAPHTSQDPGASYAGINERDFARDTLIPELESLRRRGIA